MKNSRGLLIAVAAVAVLLLIYWYGHRSLKPVGILEHPIDAQTVVRLFYLPPLSYSHPPLIFRIVGEDDRRLGTAPIVNMGGRTPFVTKHEMLDFIEELRKAKLGWTQSPTPKLVSPIPTEEMYPQMEISIFFNDRPLQAFVPPSDLCPTLAGLDRALIQPRALWEFQLYRVEYGCPVANFSRTAFPQHDDPLLEKR